MIIFYHHFLRVQDSSIWTRETGCLILVVVQFFLSSTEDTVSEPTNNVRTSLQILESIERHLAAPRDVRKGQSDDLRELYKALQKSQKSFKELIKSGFISGRNIPYAKISDLIDASRAALEAHELVMNVFMVNNDGYACIVGRLYHTASGQYMDSELPLLNNVDEQKRGSSITYAWRYIYAPLIGLVDTSYDDDGEATKPMLQPYTKR